LRKCLCGYNEDTHTVACWVFPILTKTGRVTRRTHTLAQVQKNTFYGAKSGVAD